MVIDDLTGVFILSNCVELAKVIDQRAHTRRKLQHTVHQLTQGNFTCGGRKNIHRTQQQNYVDYFSPSFC